MAALLLRLSSPEFGSRAGPMLGYPDFMFSDITRITAKMLVDG
jgi:hypothetical protein